MRTNDISRYMDLRWVSGILYISTTLLISMRTSNALTTVQHHRLTVLFFFSSKLYSQWICSFIHVSKQRCHQCRCYVFTAWDLLNWKFFILKMWAMCNKKILEINQFLCYSQYHFSIWLPNCSDCSDICSVCQAIWRLATVASHVAYSIQDAEVWLVEVPLEVNSRKGE